MEYKSYRINLLAHILLYKMYDYHVKTDRDPSLTVVAARSLIGENLVSINLVRSTLEYIKEMHGGPSREAFIKRNVKGNQHLYYITPDGLQFVEKELRRKSSLIAHFKASGDESLDEIAGIDSYFMAIAERADEEGWSPLEIDRDSENYKQALESTEQAIKIIEQDNGFPVAYPSERSGILNRLKEGLKWLKEKNPTVSDLKTLIMQPFRWIMTMFPKSIMAEAAKEASQKIYALIKSLI
jgi:hypothetical protein